MPLLLLGHMGKAMNAFLHEPPMEWSTAQTVVLSGLGSILIGSFTRETRYTATRVRILPLCLIFAYAFLPRWPGT